MRAYPDDTPYKQIMTEMNMDVRTIVRIRGRSKIYRDRAAKRTKLLEAIKTFPESASHMEIAEAVGVEPATVLRHRGKKPEGWKPRIDRNFTEEQVRDIRRSKESQSECARRYGTNPKAIRAIRMGLYYRWIQ